MRFWRIGDELSPVRLPDIYQRFPTRDSCLSHLEAVRWPQGATCPYCNSQRVTVATIERRHHCNSCNTTFSVTVGTVFHRSRADLQKWFYAVWLVLFQQSGLSYRELAVELQVNRNTAGLMAQRIRNAPLAHRHQLMCLEVTSQ